MRTAAVSAVSDKPARAAYEVGVLVKALDVLEALAWRGKSGLTELATATSANKTSVYRILNTLERRGYVTKDAQTRKYMPGHRLVALSTSIVQAVDIVRSSRPVLEDLRDEFQETVNLGVLADGMVQYLDIVEGPRSLRMAARPGARDHLHSTGLGKALLCRLDPAQARGMLEATPRPKLTEHTTTAVDALVARLAEARDRGYAIDDEENEVGARCVAAPILDRDGAPLVAISVSGPTARMNDEVVAQIGKRLMDAADHIARSVGQPPQTREPPDRP